jgi:hypothetical protein
MSTACSLNEFFKTKKIVSLDQRNLNVGRNVGRVQSVLGEDPQNQLTRE